jgi:hypothetical protein
VSKKEHEEFTVGRVNFNTIKNDGEEQLYEENNPYFEPNNAGYYRINWVNYIYDGCI